MDTGIQNFKKGNLVNFQFMFPDKIKRLLFAVSSAHEPNRNILEQIIENESMQSGVAEFAITGIATGMMPTGTYNWSIYALNTDGTRDTWFPFSEGKINLEDAEPQEKIILV